jgi:hypothetical protein
MPPAGASPMLPMPALERWQFRPGAPAAQQRFPLPPSDEDQPMLLFPPG